MLNKSSKVLIVALTTGICLGISAYAYTSNINTPQSVDEKYVTVDIKDDSISKGKDLTAEFADLNFRTLIKEILGKAEEAPIHQEDIDSYMNKNNCILKLTLGKDIKSLKGLELFNSVNSLWITNGTNTFLDYSTIENLKDLRTLTIINCKLSPSDISSSIWHCVFYNKLEELFINASFPGAKGEKYEGVTETAKGLNSPYTSALNSLGESNNKNNAGHHGLKVLSLVGNDWQGDISTLGKLIGNKCKISLNNDSHIGENVDNFERANNIETNIDYINTDN